MEFGDHFLQRYFTKQKSLKKKIVISPIGSLEPWAVKQKWLKKKLHGTCIKKYLILADVLHATSEIEAQNLVSNNVGKKIVTIAHGIDILDKKSNYENKQRKN